MNNVFYSKHGRKTNQYVCTLSKLQNPQVISCIRKNFSREELWKHFFIPFKSRLKFGQHDYQAGAWKQTISSCCSYPSMSYMPINIPIYGSYAHSLIQQKRHFPGLTVWKLLRWLNDSVRFFLFCQDLLLLNEKYGTQRLLAEQVVVPN